MFCDPIPSCSKYVPTRNESPSMFSDSEDEKMEIAISDGSIDMFDSSIEAWNRKEEKKAYVDDAPIFDSYESEPRPLHIAIDENRGNRTTHDSISSAVLESNKSDTVSSTSSAEEGKNAVEEPSLSSALKRKSLLPLDDMNLNTETTLNTLKSFGDYMRLKKDKLLYQVNVISKPLIKHSNLFEGVSIFVNGYTVPSALELRQLIQAHGGEFHVYYEYEKTTYTVAMSLASAKVKKIRVNEKIIKPDWLIDSLANGRRMPEEPYLLLFPHQKTNILAMWNEKDAKDKSVPTKKSSEKHKILDARDPNFLSEYYARSRLHLISTMAQDMRDYVNGMKMDGRSEFEYRLAFKHKMRENKCERTPPGHVIFHVDLDCFFVSVALRHRPDLVGKAVAVTHSRGNIDAPGFAEIASCSYAARARGIKNGMLMRDALQKCMDLICVPYEFEEYRDVSKKIYTIVSKYTLDIRAVSCDEMYLNVGGLLRDVTQNDALALAEDMRQRIREETGCPASVGIGPNQLIARLATRYAKPDGVRWVKVGDLSGFIAQEKITNLPGVGHSTLSKIETNFGELDTCGDLQSQSKEELIRVLGKGIGTSLYHMCRGEDETEGLSETGQRKSVSCDINYGIRFSKMEEAVTFLGVIGTELERKLCSARMKAGSLTLKVLVRAAEAPVQTAKFLGCGRCDTHNKSVVLSPLTGNGKIIAAAAIKLLKKIKAPPHELRGLGVQLGRLAPIGCKSVHKGSTRMENITKMFMPKRQLSRNSQRSNEKLGRCPSRPTSNGSFSDQHIEFEEQTNEIFLKNNGGTSKTEQSSSTPFVEPFGICPPEQSDVITLIPPLPSRISQFSNLSPKSLEIKVLEIMLITPSKRTVELLTDYIYSMIRYGELPELRKFIHILFRVSRSRDAAPEWYQTVAHLIAVADELCIKYFSATMFKGYLY